MNLSVILVPFNLLLIIFSGKNKIRGKTYGVRSRGIFREKNASAFSAAAAVKQQQKETSKGGTGILFSGKGSVADVQKFPLSIVQISLPSFPLC